MRTILGVLLRSLLFTLLMFMVGCVSHEGVNPQADPGVEAETTRKESPEEKAPPFFIYRPG